MGEGYFYMLLHYEVLVSLQKGFKLILYAVSGLEVLKIFVVPKLYLTFSFVTVGPSAVAPHRHSQASRSPRM